MRDEQFATKLYKSDADILLTVYQGKQNKNVLLLSTLQSTLQMLPEQTTKRQHPKQ